MDFARSYQKNVFTKDLQFTEDLLVYWDSKCFKRLWLRLLQVLPKKLIFDGKTYLKTWLKSTMTQNRVNRLTMLQCHKEGTDNFDLAAVTNTFLSKHDTKISIFWTFSVNDFPKLCTYEQLSIDLINTN